MHVDSSSNVPRIGTKSAVVTIRQGGARRLLAYIGYCPRYPRRRRRRRTGQQNRYFPQLNAVHRSYSQELAGYLIEHSSFLQNHFTHCILHSL